LKVISEKYFPLKMIRRPKEGFLMPIPQWLGTTLNSFAKEIVSEKLIKKNKLMNWEQAKKLIKNCKNKKPSYFESNKLYSILMLNLWIKQNEII